MVKKEAAEKVQNHIEGPGDGLPTSERINTHFLDFVCMRCSITSPCVSSCCGTVPTTRRPTYLPEEIIRMFPIKEDAEEVYPGAEDNTPSKHNRQTAKARMEKEGTCSESPDDAISEEVQDMFDEAQDIGRARSLRII